MVLPDSPGSDSSRPKTGRTALFVAAALLIVVGFTALGVLSPAEPVAIEETTTTSTTIEEVEPPIDPENFTVDQIARGEPFEWRSAMHLDDTFPIALFDHEGWIYLFSTERPNFSGFDQGGLRGWRTADAESWEPLGQVIPESHVITRVSSTGQGVVALEWRESGKAFALWQSDNGIEWSVEEVPVQDLDVGRAVSPSAAGGSDSMLVVAGQVNVDVHRRLQERLSSQGGESLDLTLFGWGIEIIGDEVQFQLYGPLGFPLAVVTSDELGLSPEEVEAVIDEYEGRDPETIVWSRREESGWQQAEIPGAFSIETIRATPDGDVVAFGYGRTGFSTWSSRDGLNWEETAATRGPYRIDDWHGRLVGPSDTGRAAVVVSDEDDSWEDIGPATHFPNAFDWTIDATGAGPGGIAAMITGWDRGSFEPVEPGEPPELTSNGATLTLDLYNGSYTLQTPDGTMHTWTTQRGTPEGVSLDMANAAITFHDPDTGDLIAAFPIEDIREVQNSYWAGHPSPAAHHAFAFTPDGVEWTIQDLLATCPNEGWCRIFGRDSSISHLEVTESHVVAIIVMSAAGRFDPTLPPGFQVWSAPIP